MDDVIHWGIKCAALSETRQLGDVIHWGITKKLTADQEGVKIGIFVPLYFISFNASCIHKIKNNTNT